MAALDKVVTGQVTLGVARVKIVSARKERDGVEVTKFGSQFLFLGCSTVTAVNGHLFAGACGTSKIYPTSDELWGITAAGDETISFLEIFPR